MITVDVKTMPDSLVITLSVVIGPVIDAASDFVEEDGCAMVEFPQLDGATLSEIALDELLDGAAEADELLADCDGTTEAPDELLDGAAGTPDELLDGAAETDELDGAAEATELLADCDEAAEVSCGT